MIGAAGYYEYMKGVRADLTLNAVPNLPLGDRERRFHGRQSL
jgi:N6-L-threonylcarbamoyladenine synthase